MWSSRREDLPGFQGTRWPWLQARCFQHFQPPRSKTHCACRRSRLDVTLLSFDVHSANRSVPGTPPHGATLGGGIVVGWRPLMAFSDGATIDFFHGMRAGMSARGGGLNPTGVLPRNIHAESTPPWPVVAQVQDSCATRAQLVCNSYRTHTYNSSQKQLVFELSGWP